MNLIIVENGICQCVKAMVMLFRHPIISNVLSVKFPPKIKSESGKLSTIGCHIPPKLTNFGMLHCLTPLLC